MVGLEGIGIVAALLPKAGPGAAALGAQVAAGACADGDCANEVRQVQKLVEELADSGAKFSPEKLVRIARTAQGQIVFLEQGTEKSGLQHILQGHATDFANSGVAAADVPDLVIKAVTEGKIVGYQGQGMGRPIYEVVFNGAKQLVAVTVGSNGYIVGANPATLP